MATATKKKAPAKKKSAPKVEEAPAVVEAAPLGVAQPAITDMWVATIEKYLREQVWQQVSNAQYAAIVDALIEKLKES